MELRNCMEMMFFITYVWSMNDLGDFFGHVPLGTVGLSNERSTRVFPEVAWWERYNQFAPSKNLEVKIECPGYWIHMDSWFFDSRNMAEIWLTIDLNHLLPMQQAKKNSLQHSPSLFVQPCPKPGSAGQPCRWQNGVLKRCPAAAQRLWSVPKGPPLGDGIFNKSPYPLVI